LVSEAIPDSHHPAGTNLVFALPVSTTALNIPLIQKFHPTFFFLPTRTVFDRVVVYITPDHGLLTP